MNNNKLKTEMLREVELALEVVSSKMNILDALDQDSSCSGRCDLVDQLHLMTGSLDTLKRATHRATLVVPVG
jgi:hypothetical protein